MTVTLNKNQVGLSLGVISALSHALWVTLVATGLGQAIADWTHSIHFLTNPYTITSVDAVVVLVGIVGAFITGYVVGWVFALIWNWSGEKLKSA